MPEALPTATSFGTLPNGAPVQLYTLASDTLRATLTDYGARLVSLQAPDASGTLAHVVLGYGTLALYLTDKTYSGATIGRFANRVAHGRFTLDGHQYQIPQNDATNALHGGAIGFDRRVWTAASLPGAIEFTLVSPAGDQGFPGTLTVTVRYTLTGPSLRIDYTATTEAPTVVNLTNHTYFNLSGGHAATILDHHITLPTDAYTPVTEALIPTGELAPVTGTPFDLRRPTRIGIHIDDPDHQLQRTGGYDHNWVLGPPGQMKPAATLYEPTSGRTLTVQTTEPGIQFYSGNFIDGTMPNRLGGLYPRRAGLCLETQHYPDSPNHPIFPTTTLRPSETLRSSTIFTFGAEPA